MSRAAKYPRIAERIDERYRCTTGNKGKPHDAASCPEEVLFVEVCSLAAKFGLDVINRELTELNKDRRKAGSRDLWFSPGGLPKPE